MKAAFSCGAERHSTESSRSVAELWKSIQAYDSFWAVLCLVSECFGWTTKAGSWKEEVSKWFCVPLW